MEKINNLFDGFNKDRIVDFTIYDLLKEKIIQYEDVECFKREIGRGLKTSKTKAFLAKMLRQYSRALFWLRW